MDFKSKIVLISGPTASGKSSFAIQLAKKINGEIINADSMQIYKQLRILSARPDPKKYQKINHHLYGFHDAKKSFSTGDWLKLTKQKIKKIQKKNMIPIIVGGTGLYFKALVDGLVRIPNIPARNRKEVRNLHQRLGQREFFKKLLKIDPYYKGKINPSDSQRSIRAYEVKKFTKKSLNEWFKNTKSDFSRDDFVKIYIDYPRQELIERINIRTDQMIKKGAIKEVKDFLKLKIKKDMSVLKAIGISEIKGYLSKKKELDEIKEKISIKTRQYAKRQSTWARSNMMTWIRLKPQDLNKFLKKI